MEITINDTGSDDFTKEIVCTDPYTPCVPPNQAALIFYVSFLLGFSSFQALWMGLYFDMILFFCVFATSVNYWRKPDYSWRRYLDMTCASIGISLHMLRAYGGQYALVYYGFISCGLCSYVSGMHFHKNGMLWHSTIAHATLHILAYIGGVYLYAGTLLPITANPLFQPMMAIPPFATMVRLNNEL